MKNRAILILLILILLAPCIAEGRGGGMEGDSASVPRVAYSKPSAGSTIDLAGRKSVLFEWNMVPIPSGGRETFKFILLKGSGYDEIYSQLVDARTFSIEVPADKFEDGARYRWHVKQRDAKSMVWSQYDDWYFTVIKK